MYVAFYKQLVRSNELYLTINNIPHCLVLDFHQEEQMDLMANAEGQS